MHRSQFQRIEQHPLRYVLLNVCNDPRDLPTKSELREAIKEACPEGTDQKVLDALFTKAQELAKRSVDVGARFDARAAANELTLHVVETWEADERLLPAETEDTEPIDVGEIVDGLNNPAERALDAIVASRKADELEANRVRQMGGTS
jgi:hypothetical protein